MRKQLLIAFSLFSVSGWFALAAPASACQATISGNASVSGNWFSTCTSANRRGAYAQYYTFTLTETAVVQIDLESSVDPYLYLLAGDRPVNRSITSNDNSAGNFNSRIVRLLTAGTYTIEATTRNTGLTGTFRLSVWTNGGPGSCRSIIGPNADANGSWTADCVSIHRTGSYARYYTFTIPATTSVQIDLVSNADSYLHLLSGNSPAGGSITSNDNSGGNFNARVIRTLVPGTYTIEATTDDPAVTGSFRLAVRSAGGGEACRKAINVGATARGNWTPACTSVHRPGSYARYYTFTLANPTNVQIDLSSSAADSYLYLLAGASPSNNAITSNDNSGGNFNARIARTLQAGTYTIEAATRLPGAQGAFTLKVARLGKGELIELEEAFEEEP